MFFRPARQHGRNPRDAKLGRLFQAPLEMVEFEHRHIQVDRQRGVGFELLMQDKVDPLRTDLDDLRPM